jgi:hypothetical protein
MLVTANTTIPQPATGRLEYLAALWARQTGRKIVIEPRPAGR